jgi:hypothetical protein
MDSFTRHYSFGLGALVLALIGIWIYSSWSPRAREIDKVLQADPVVAAYPYRFRVLSVSDGVATISTPRSFDLPAVSFLPILYPELANAAQDDPRMIAAQQKLVDAQKRAMTLVQSQPDVRQIKWELDVRWLADRGVTVPQGQ